VIGDCWTTLPVQKCQIIFVTFPLRNKVRNAENLNILALCVIPIDALALEVLPAGRGAGGGARLLLAIATR